MHYFDFVCTFAWCQTNWHYCNCCFFFCWLSSLARSLSTSFHFNFHICNVSMHRSLWLNSLCIRKVVCYFFSLSFSLFFSRWAMVFFRFLFFILICVVQSCIISAIKNFNLYLFLYLIYKITIFISVILLLLALVHSGNLLCAYEWLWVCSLRLFFVCTELTCTNEKKKTTDAPKTKWINNCKSEKHQR